MRIFPPRRPLAALRRRASIRDALHFGRARVAVIELRIDELAAGGDGVGRAPDGRVVFVPFTAPGDRVRVQLTQTRPRFARARVETLLEPGPARTDPVCPVFGSCGGCAWQHVAYPAQLAAKARILEDALRRIGKLSLPGELTVEPSPSAYGYRSRARVLVEGGRVGFRRRSSHVLCATTRCPVLLPALDAELHALARQPPRDEGEWELAWGGDAVRRAPLAAAGHERVWLEVAGERVGISPGVFAQANALLLPALAERLLACAGSGAAALELYAGAGCFTLPLARRFEKLVALEADAGAVADLHANLAASGTTNVDVMGETLEHALAREGLALLAPEVLVLDPPRAGLPEGAVAALARLRPARVVYLSCDPATLARDLALWFGAGWALRSVQGFDLFPQTPHIEALALLERD
jgi:23S rRNA (uracil1939-C5)-methyltransferase